MNPTPSTRTEHSPPSCPRSGGTLIEVARSSRPHHAELRCPACGKHIKYLRAPWTKQRAETFRVPLGARAGSTLAELARTQRGREYLAWMGTHLQGSPGIAARMVLSPTWELLDETNRGQLSRKVGR
jgi:hypothetical protein